MKEPLPPDQEAQAQQLAHDIAQASHGELLQVARTLIAAGDADLFGPNEFKVRDLAHKVAAKAYEKRLAPKKTATRARG